MMTYTQAIQYLYDRLPVFHHIGGNAYKPGLDNTIRLLNALDNPQHSYKTIHIAGTNGKGSVSHMVAAVLQQAGYKVGLYTSPHLVDFGERIRINGEKIEQTYVSEFVEGHKELFDTVQPSFFEATMAMAFAYFAQKKVDVAVIEVGLGGRLDSTNIIRPEVSIITNISFDHTAFLGDTLAKIAAEKAGIIKNGTPVIIGESLPETRDVFESKAREMNAPIVFAEEQLHITAHKHIHNQLYVEMSDGNNYTVGLTGNYQLKNIVTAVTGIKTLQQNPAFELSDNDISEGLKHVIDLTGLQGRWQTVSENPRIVLDTGHNVAGIENVVLQLKEQHYKTLRIVIGMVNDKDISTVLTLLPKEAVYYFTQAHIARALPATELQRRATPNHLQGIAYNSVAEALQAARNEADSEDFIFIGGSNFVVGEALETLDADKKQ